MLHDPMAGKRIVKDAMRGEDGDPLGELNPLDIKFFRNLRANLQLCHVDPVVFRRQAVFLANEFPHLIAAMDQLADRRAKSLLVHSTIQRWNQAFARMVLPADRYKKAPGKASGSSMRSVKPFPNGEQFDSAPEHQTPREPDMEECGAYWIAKAKGGRRGEE